MIHLTITKRELIKYRAEDGLEETEIKTPLDYLIHSGNERKELDQTFENLL